MGFIFHIQHIIDDYNKYKIKKINSPIKETKIKSIDIFSNQTLLIFFL